MHTEQGIGYEIHGMTVIARRAPDFVDWWDMNEGGYPCGSAAELVDFIDQLEDQGAFDVATRDALKMAVEGSR